MNQLTFASVEEDVLASMIRRQQGLCRQILRDIQTKNISTHDVNEQIKKLEKGLRQLCHES